MGSLSSYARKRSIAELFLEVERGNVAGYSTIHKFGRNEAVSTTLVPVCDGGIYPTPTGVVTLAAISDDANDTADGSGAQQITLNYLDTNFTEQTATIEMNGTDETTGTVAGVKRLYRAFVSRSGTYATQSASSQKGTITIRVASAGATWASIPEIGTSGFAVGQSLIGCYTVPAGKTAYILTTAVSVDSAKSADLYFFARDNSDDTTTPYSGIMRVKNIFTGVQGFHEYIHKTFEPYQQKTDIGWMATAATTSDVSVEFGLLVIDN